MKNIKLNDLEKKIYYSSFRSYEVQLFLFFSIPYSLFPIPYSLFPIPYSLLPVACCLKLKILYLITTGSAVAQKELEIIFEAANKTAEEAKKATE